jgi:hypothetical protein
MSAGITTPFSRTSACGNILIAPANSNSSIMPNRRTACDCSRACFSEQKENQGNEATKTVESPGKFNSGEITFW